MSFSTSGPSPSGGVGADVGPEQCIMVAGDFGYPSRSVHHIVAEERWLSVRYSRTQDPRYSPQLISMMVSPQPLADVDIDATSEGGFPAGGTVSGGNKLKAYFRSALGAILRIFKFIRVPRRNPPISRVS